MAVPFEKLHKDILDQRAGFAIFLKLAGYFHDHANDYTGSEQERIEHAIDDMEAHYNPADCMTINKLTIQAGGAYARYGREKGIAFCTQAKQTGMNLSDYIDEYVPNVKTYWIDKYIPSTYAREAAQQMIRRREEPIREAAPSTKAEAELRIEAGSLIHEINRLREDFTEEAEAMRRTYEKHLSEVRAELQRIRTEKGESVVMPEAPKQVTKVFALDATEYDLLRKEIGAYKHTYLGKEDNKFLVEFTDDSIPDLDKFITELKFRADQIKEERRQARPKAAPLSGEDEVLAEFASIFKRETGRKPNAADLASLRSLSKSLLQMYYGIAGEEGAKPDYKRLFALDLALDLKPSTTTKQLPELLDQAYNRFKARLQSLFGKAVLEEAEAELCDEDSEASAFFDLYIYTEKIAQGQELTRSEDRKLNESKDFLYKCGYTDAKYTQYLDKIISYYADRGVNFDDMLRDYLGEGE